MMRLLIGGMLNGEPQQLQDGPGDSAASEAFDPHTSVGIGASSFLLMVAFGFLVVVLMFSLIVARFALRVTTVMQSVDRAYKLKFAQMAFASLAQLNSSTLAPQPFNVLRRAMLTSHELAGWLATLSQPRKDTTEPPRRPTIGPGQRRTALEGGASITQLTDAKVSKSYDALSAALIDANAGGNTNSASMAKDVRGFVQRALSVQRLYPEYVVDYCVENENLLVDSSKLVVRVSEMRRAQVEEAERRRITDKQRDVVFRKLAARVEADMEMRQEELSRRASQRASAQPTPGRARWGSSQVRENTR